MGLFNNDSTQSVTTDQGLRTQYGIILPPGARVAAYVRSTGLQSGDGAFLNDNLVLTLAQGLARVRAGLGDFVVCLPGHAENVADATTFSNALLAGTKILGVGRGGNTPTFTWTATTSKWDISVADVFIGGLRLLFDGINAVANAINVNAADFGMSFCEFEMSTTAKSPTVGITLTANATRCDISGNLFRGLSTVAVGDGILISGACDSPRICDNEMIFAATSATGLVHITAAATNLKILRNTMSNTVATSVAAIAFGAVAATGHVANNTIQVLSTGAITQGTTGITVGATTTANFYQNFVANDPRTSGILSPAADT